MPLCPRATPPARTDTLPQVVHSRTAISTGGCDLEHTGFSKSEPSPSIHVRVTAKSFAWVRHLEAPDKFFAVCAKLFSENPKLGCRLVDCSDFLRSDDEGACHTR